MVWLFVIIIILIIYFNYKSKEKFSNPPAQTDIEYLKNYIKVSKYTLDQALKKVTKTANAKFTTANAFLAAINDTMTLLNNTTNTLNNTNTNLNNLSTRSETFSTDAAPVMENFVIDLINRIIENNGILQLPQYLINNYTRIVQQVTYNIQSNNTSKLTAKERLIQCIMILESINTNIFKFVFNKLITSTNDINESINNIGTSFTTLDSNLLGTSFDQSINNTSLPLYTISDITPPINPSDAFTNVYPYDFGYNGTTDDVKYKDIDIITTAEEQKGTLEQCKLKCASMSNCSGFARTYGVSDDDASASACFYKQSLPLDANKELLIPNRKYASGGFNQWIRNNSSPLTLQYSGENPVTYGSYVNVYPYSFGYQPAPTNPTDPNYSVIDIADLKDTKGTLDDCKNICNKRSDCNAVVKMFADNPNDKNSYCGFKTNLPKDANGNYLSNNNYAADNPNKFNTWIKKPNKYPINISRNSNIIPFIY
jgi:hypothetical protein